VTFTFLNKTYTLKGIAPAPGRMWEFAPEGETLENWTTLVTLIDRPDAADLKAMDQVSQGILEHYQKNGGQIMMAKSLKGSDGQPFNFLIGAFDQKAHHRFELNYVRVFMRQPNAMIAIFAARVSDEGDYLVKAKSFLDHQSGLIGHALETTVFPNAQQLREARV